MGLKIFQGANGYYVAWEREDGFHWQPADRGGRLGWDKKEAERELARQEREQEAEDE